MAHPYKAAGHKSDPRWFSGVKKMVESVEVQSQAKARDGSATERNYGGDAGAMETAAYESDAERKKGKV